MTVFILYPAVAFLAMFVVLVIMLILRYGGRCMRHEALPDRDLGEFDEPWKSKGYDHSISYA